jgi:hypothetical protein
MERFLARHFTAFNRLCEELAIPDEINQEISEGVIALIQNATVKKIEADDFSNRQQDLIDWIPYGNYDGIHTETISVTHAHTQP